MEAMSKTRLLRLVRITGIALVGSGAVAWLTMLGYSTAWTGFGLQAATASHAKTLWDWMDLLLMPMFLVSSLYVVYRNIT